MCALHLNLALALRCSRKVAGSCREHPGAALSRSSHRTGGVCTGAVLLLMMAAQADTEFGLIAYLVLFLFGETVSPMEARMTSNFAFITYFKLYLFVFACMCMNMNVTAGVCRSEDSLWRSILCPP